jgi:hypothetical protein
MSESKHSNNRIILQLIGSITGVLLFAFGGTLFVNPLYNIIFWAVNKADSPFFFPFTEYYVSTLLGIFLGLVSIGLGIDLMLWSRPRSSV